MILLGLNYLLNWFPELAGVHDSMILFTVFGGVTLLGIFISWISTYFALRKYLRLKSDLLY
jgi:cell division transport system permease protein